MTQGADDDASGGDHADDSNEVPSPGDWAELARRVLEANIYHMVNPANDPVMIGRFEAIVRIGQGGFGTVFKARDPDLDRLVALKLCRPCSQDASDELVREAKVLARLDHPNIITIFELGDHDGAVFFAMPYVAGQNAAKFADRDPPPSVQEILHVYRHVARGLAAAHAEGIVHGDIKPSNLLLDRDDFARIADFGLAKKLIEDAAESEQEGLWRRAGTLHYMAPEVLLGEDGDAQSDQFSFFVALCQTLAVGKLPFYGKTSEEVLDAIEHTDILQFLGPWVPAQLKAVIRIGLSLDPSERFPDMETVEAELDRLLQMPPPSSPLRDEPEHGEPESEGPDGPERMHEPEQSDQPALIVGEPDVMVGEPPPIHPEVMVEASLPSGVSSGPLGSDSLGGLEAIEKGPPWEINPNLPAVVRRGLSIDPPSSVRRTASWIAFGVALGGTLAGGLALLLLGPASDATASVDVELPEPSKVSKPIELPYPHNLTSPCAMGDEEMSIADEELLTTCTQIRNGQLESAQTGWKNARDDKRVSGDVSKLAEHTLIVARTFVDHAIVTQHAGPEDAAKAAILGDEWARYAAYLIDPREGLNDPRVSEINTRAKPLLPR